MKLPALIAHAKDKTRFTTLEAYIEFASRFLDFIPGKLQADIISKNEPDYHFWQFKEDGHLNFSRPINSRLMFTAEQRDLFSAQFLSIVKNIRDAKQQTAANRECINRTIYTLQQCIGIALDALPSAEVNTARKVVGDLFERLILLLLQRLGISCTSGTIRVPIKVEGGDEFHMNYQHDLIVSSGELVKVIGSVKTSSKDRIDKVFVDKFLLARLTGKHVPHVAIFLNDVQRKPTGPKHKPTGFGVSTTFLPGHFKGYTVKLNPLDGVYYCDIRPSMQVDALLKQHIKTFDHFVFTDIWELLNRDSLEATIEE